jgi:nucleoside-diphosphate-sugar epimerase
LRVLVTGSSGFVGGRVCDRLVRDGHAVTAAVRRVGSAPVGTTEVVVGDLGEGTQWGPAVQDQDVVVHLAARVHVMNEKSSDPLQEFRRSNVEGTRSLAEQAVRAGVRRFVYVSSIKASGESTRSAPISASTPDHPTEPYGLSKLEAERVVSAIGRKAGMTVVLLRPALIYGPGAGGNVLRLLRAVDRGVPLPLGSVHNRRSMIFVENFAALTVAAACGNSAPKSAILATDSETLSTAEVVRALAAGMQRHPRLVSIPTRLLRFAARVAGRSADVDRLVGDLVVESNVSLIEEYSEAASAHVGLEATGRAYAARNATPS